MGEQGPVGEQSAVNTGCVPVAVVVVSWNSAGFLQGCLDSVLGLEPAPAEILVVDNGSVDGSAALVRRRFPRIRMLELAENIGFCGANNLGIRRTTSPFVLVLNPDTTLEPDFLERLLPAFDDPAVGMAAGKLFRFDRNILDSCGQLLARSRQPIDRGYGRPDSGEWDKDGEVFGVCGAAALYRRAMLESIADPGDCYFDESFFAFYEDLDLAWRARRLGWRAVYRHRAVGYHARGGSAEGGRNRRFAAMLGRRQEIRFHIVKNRYLTILRNDTPRGYVANLPFILCRDIATLALILLRSPGVLARLWKEREIFGRALEMRRLDAGRPRPHLEQGNQQRIGGQ
jgi:GT2 family glycosyltransferase